LKSNWLTFSGLFATFAYILSIFALVHDDIDKLGTTPLNELGDFLTGVFGPIAVFWLIIGYFQQGSELKLSVRALELQAEELKRSVEQQSRIAELSHDQLKHELSRHREEQASRAAMDRGAFVVYYNGCYQRIDGLIEHHIFVVNLGQAVAAFSFHYNEGLQMISSDIFEDDDIEVSYPVWEKHRGRRYSYVISSAIDESKPSFELSYRNLDGTVVDRNFHVKLVRGSSFEDLILVENGVET
jgi:hypothetical protein